MKPYYEEGGITIYHADCREVLPMLTIGRVVTDPPFNIGKDYDGFGDDLSPDDYAAMLATVAGVCDSQAWVTPREHLLLYLTLLGVDARPVVIRRGAQGPQRWGWYDQFNLVLMRGKPTRLLSNCWDDIRLRGEGYFFREDDYGHPGYTPYPLIARLVGVLPGGGVLCDPFLGTGTTAVAAKSAGIPFVGIEQSERYCEIAAKRLAQEVFDFAGCGVPPK